ncbi:PREDICTED: uncharacterized protein LOC108772816, partial [Cyphomyrmex costatus]|uniref:uncharacterized protein LOC108772816 n=1 Tax=Cyphomyrmex costatus TaxID=456900 RepID=UPI00085226AA
MGDEPSKKLFQSKWLYIEEFKHWLRKVPGDDSLCYCIICDKSFACGLSQIYRHAETKAHINKYESSEIRQLNEDLNTESNDESLLSFDERTKEAEIRYAALIAEINIPYQSANKILSFFQHVGKDPHILRSMKMGRTKCKSIITNVLAKVETERVVDNIRNTKFSIFIDETSDICNEKWMTFQVRYPDPGTLEIRTQLVELINIDAKDSSADKLFNAFKNEMYKFQVPFSNIIALSCDN